MAELTKSPQILDGVGFLWADKRSEVNMPRFLVTVWLFQKCILVWNRHWWLWSRAVGEFSLTPEKYLVLSHVDREIFQYDTEETLVELVPIELRGKGFPRFFSAIESLFRRLGLKEKERKRMNQMSFILFHPSLSHTFHIQILDITTPLVQYFMPQTIIHSIKILTSTFIGKQKNVWSKYP